MAATSIPQLIAYAESAGYASYRGLSTAGPPLLAWGLVTGSPYMNAGVTSITAIMTKADLGGGGGGNDKEQAYVALVAAYSFWIGVASIALALVGFGRVAQMVPPIVRHGFKWGCATGVLLAALPNGLLANGSSDEMKRLVASSHVLTTYILPYKAYVPGLVSGSQIAYILLQPTVWNGITAALFFGSTVVVQYGSRYMPSFFPPGTEVILVTLVAIAYSLYAADSYHGALVGDIPVVESSVSIFGLQLPSVEFLSWRTLWEAPLVMHLGHGSMLQSAIRCTLFAAVNFLSIMGIAGTFETENGIAWSPARELCAQGVSCWAAAAVGSAPVSGSLSRSLVSRLTGATSPLACIVTATCWMLFQSTMGIIMAPCPKAALSAIIVAAVVQGVVRPKELLETWRQDNDWRARIVGWGTGWATICTSPTQGFGIGLVLYFVVTMMVWPRPQQPSFPKQQDKPPTPY